jgi:DNA-binding MarR family transcriptional regulator/DNA-binding transcriptional ArsR family regulator
MGKGAGSCSDRPAIAFGSAAVATAVEEVAPTLPERSIELLELLAAGEGEGNASKLWMTLNRDALYNDVERETAFDALVSIGMYSRTQSWENGAYSQPTYYPTPLLDRFQAHARWHALDVEAQVALAWLSEHRYYAHSITDVSAATGAPFEAAKEILVELTEAGLVDFSKGGQYRGYRCNEAGIKTVRCGVAPQISLEPGPPLPLADFEPVASSMSDADREDFWHRVPVQGQVARVDDGKKPDPRLETLVVEGWIRKWGHHQTRRDGEGYRSSSTASYRLTEAGQDRAMQRYRRELTLAEESVLQYFSGVKTSNKSHQSLRQHARLKRETGVPGPELSRALASLVASRLLERRQQNDYYGKRCNGWALTDHGARYVRACLD